MKKVLIFSIAYYPKHVGGAEVAIKEKVSRISDIEFHMVTLRYDSTLPKVEKIGNVLVHRIGFSKPNATIADLKKFPLHYNKYWFQFAAALKALSLHRHYKYDAIWAMMAHPCGVPGAIFKIFNKNVPFILELQEGDPPEYIEKLMKPVWLFFKRAFTSADVVEVISTFLGNWAKQMGFKGEIEVIPNAVNVKHFSQKYSIDELDYLKKKIGKNKDDIYLITTSRLVHKNAVDDVIKSLELLPSNIKFLVLGIGPDEEMLRNLSKKSGVESRVIFLGQVDHKEMPKYLKVSDIFIRPSRSEGMGNSFVEAFAAELPVIATQEGGISDFLYDAKRNPDKQTTGWAVDKDSPGQIAKAVQEIMSDKNKVKKVIETAKKLAEDKYDWDLIAKNMKEKVFDKVFQKK